MRLSPREIEKLMLHNAGFVAQKRYARGLKLNYTESIALIASQTLEFIREGRSVAELMDLGKQFLGYADVMPGVAEMIHDVQVEGTFPDGSKLVTVHTPVCSEAGNPELALYGSGLTRAEGAGVKVDNSASATPGEYVLEEGSIELNAGRETVTVAVTNTGDRPVQVGSHYLFFETNPGLRFDREKAFGKRLNIPAGTAIRFEPGEVKDVELVAIDGENIVYGGNALTSGEASEARRSEALAAAIEQGFEHESQEGEA